MLEVEIKAFCASHREMTALLMSKGAVQTGINDETDYYYNHPARDFRETNEALRLRIENGKCRITYKGPKLGGMAKSRYEAETGIEEYEVMKSILEKLGFRYAGTVEKKRMLFDLNGTTVCLDTVQGLGDYIELEKIGEDNEALEKELLILAADLGIHVFERRSYLSMVLGCDEK